jgi:sensor histidine kinase YesM
LLPASCRPTPSLREPLSTVEREFALARAYLTVMATRLGPRLRFEVRAAPDCAAHPLPPLMLLTLVENAIRHGIEPLPQGGQIRLLARHEGAQLCIDVADTGAGLQSPSPSPGQGLGLANVRDRLASLYGPAAHLSIQQQDGGGVLASIRLTYAPAA